MPEGRKPIIIFGQDESIFNQFSSRRRQWTGPTGQRAIMPKSSGAGLMISAFQSCEVGLINIRVVIIIFVYCLFIIYNFTIVIPVVVIVDCCVAVRVWHGN
jgi:hypothetical protein